MKLLIVDDSVKFQQRLSAIISEITGIRDIEYAEDVPGAIEAVKEKKPDVVVLDFQIPGGSGIDVLKAVQMVNPRPVIIVFTNYPYPEFRKSCLAVGADYFFDKSFAYNELMCVLNRLKCSAE
ncbi:Phosphate regulon transcriptional regulatory protein PhoB [subsurface metagenome]